MGEIAHVQNPVMNHGKANGWFVRRIEYIGRRGCPDTMFVKAGRLILMEFKDFSKEPTLQQEREIARLKKAGVLVFVVDNPAEGRKILDRHDPDQL